MGLVKLQLLKSSVKIFRYGHADRVSSCTAHSIYITMDLTQYAATPLHVHNDLFLPKFLTIATLARLKYELSDDGQRPKHVGAFYYEF
jgi:hypothetical protein